MPWPDWMFQGPDSAHAKAVQDQQIADAAADFDLLNRTYGPAIAECYRRSGTTPAGSSRGWPYDR